MQYTIQPESEVRIGLEVFRLKDYDRYAFVAFRLEQGSRLRYVHYLAKAQALVEEVRLRRHN